MRRGETVNRSTGALGDVIALVEHYTIAQTVAGHDAQHAVLFALAIAFIIHEEEEPVFLNRTAERPPKNVANELRRSVGLACYQLGLLDEIVVGAGNGVAMIFVE